jgi:hypothetical protein
VITNLSCLRIPNLNCLVEVIEGWGGGSFMQDKERRMLEKKVVQAVLAGNRLVIMFPLCFHNNLIEP